MIKLSGLLLLILIALQPGCKKSNDTVGETKAHVIDGGDIAADGTGFHIRIDGTDENVIPINLPSGYQQPAINAPVALKFVDTGKRQQVGYGLTNTLGWRVVYIITIRKL